MQSKITMSNWALPKTSLILASNRYDSQDIVNVHALTKFLMKHESKETI